MNNSIMSSKNTIVKTIIDAEPVLFGAGAAAAKVVKFAYGSLDKAAKATTDGQIAFGYDETTKAGAIYVGGNLVTSKILDITKADTEKVAGVTAGVAETITVKYVDENGAVQSTNFAVVDQKLVQELIAARAEADNARIEALETYAKATNIAAADGALTVTPAGEAEDFKTYTVGVNVDGVTVIKNADSKVLEAGKTLAIQDAAALDGVENVVAGHKYITLTAADKTTVESAIDLCDIVGSSLIESTAYDPSTGELTITWKTADGTATANTTVIDLAAMLDINDMSVVEASQKYLTVDLSGAENSQAKFTVHTKAVADATAEATGLADAADVKAYVDSKVASVSAEGDDYVSASYDDATSKITVAADVQQLTVGKEGEANSTLSGVEKSLVDGKDVAEKVSAFVEARLGEEVAKLDSNVTSDDAAVATVEVVETDGKITDVVVTNISAGVNRDGDAEGARKLTASNATGAVTGADVATIKGYVDDRLSDMTSAQDSSVTASDSSYVNMEVVMENGALSSASIDLNVDTALTADGGWNAGAVADSAALKRYLDSSFGGMTATVADRETAKSFVDVSTSQANGVITGTHVGVVYGTYGAYSADTATVSAATDGVATVADTQAFVTSALTWTIL